MSASLDDEFAQWLADGGRQALIEAGVQPDHAATSAGRTDATPAGAGLTERHRRLYRRMLFYAKGRAGCTVSQERLAADLGLPNPKVGGKVQVRRLIQRLVTAGWVEVVDRDHDPGHHSGWLQTGNIYRLTGPDSEGLKPPRRPRRIRADQTANPQVISREQPDAQAPRSRISPGVEPPSSETAGQPINAQVASREQANPQVASREHLPTVLSKPVDIAATPQVTSREQPVDNQRKFLTEGKPSSTTCSRDGVEPVAGRRAGGEQEPWPTDPAGNYLPVTLHTPEHDRLDHQPTASELLATIAAGLGDTTVLGTIRNDDPDREVKLARLASRGDGLPEGWVWAKRWQHQPVGSCFGCGAPAHTPGPDERPWHASCWSCPPSTSPAYTTARGRPIDLAGCSTADLHRALDQLDRDTCSDLDRCSRDGRQRCRRHTRRSQREQGRQKRQRSSPT